MNKSVGFIATMVKWRTPRGGVGNGRKVASPRLPDTVQPHLARL